MICVQGRFESAIRDYTQAIQLNPGHCRAYYNRAFSHDRLGQFEDAVADYSRALQIEPANAAALHNRGSLFERMGRCVVGGLLAWVVGGAGVPALTQDPQEHCSYLLAKKHASAVAAPSP